MKFFSSICVLIWTIFASVNAKSATGDRLLVVLEESSDKASYSQLWQDLESRSFQITYESPKTDSLSLFKLGRPAYDHVLLFPPKSKGYGPHLTPKNILDFTNAGGNVLLALSSDAATPSAIASLLLEFDISLPTDRFSHVVDHFHYDTTSSSESHDVLVLPQPLPARSDLVNFFGGAGVLAVPKAVAQALGNASPLLSTILRAPSTAYTHNPKEDADAEPDLFVTGSQIALVSAMQARNSARFTVLGSLEMLQDHWFNAEVKTPTGKSSKTANKEFARQLTEWTFKEVGVLKAGRVEHHQILEDATKPLSNTTQVGFTDPEIYRIKTDLSYSIELSHWDRTHWSPYVHPSTDAVQLEFSMLTPFHRLPLKVSATTSNATVYGATFRTPDQHGIFAFKVNYKRPFLTNIEERRQVTVRHFAHDEWPRSYVISAAWPWIAGLWTVIGGFVLFVVLWLYCEPSRENVGEKVRRETS